MLRSVVDTVNLIKELTPLENKAIEVWGRDYQDILNLYKELHRTDYF